MLNKFMQRCLHQEYAQKVCSIFKHGFKHNAPFIRVRKDVAAAIASDQPVVALESTIITHGLPYPENLKSALSVEQIIRENGALPATIGIINGELIVGMSKGEIESLVEKKSDVIKTSRRDLSYVVSQNANGGTTVSGTMVAANMAGIDVFVTGGIGGVHRGASETFDISADLMELSKTPVAVICSGVKSILDIGLTLEYLETQGVPVITFGSSRYFPAFFTPKSKFKTPYNLELTTDVAKIIHNQFSMNLNTGIVVGVPIPSDNSSNVDRIEDVIQNALEEAKLCGIAGKDITPFVLEKMVELTKGDSLDANIKLIENNAKIGAQISVELSKLKSRNGKASISRTRTRINAPVSEEIETRKRAVIIGGSIFDIKATVGTISDIAEETNRGKLHTSFGGVGRNITECLGRLGTDPLLISSVGKDHQGEMLLNNMLNLGIDTSGIYVADTPTASYSVVANNTGELIMAVGDMENHDGITPDKIHHFKDNIKDAGIVVVDGNISESALKATLQLCSDYNVPTWFEPTTVGRAGRPFVKGGSNINISFVSPNYLELKAIHDVLTCDKQAFEHGSDNCEQSNIINKCLHLCKPCMSCIDNIVITLGKHGILIVSKIPSSSIFSSNLYKNRENISTNLTSVLHYPAANANLLPVSVKSVSGAGDSFASGVIFGFLQGYDTDTCIKGGLLAAYKSLHTYVAISDEITPDLLSYESIHGWATFDGNVIRKSDTISHELEYF